MGSPARRRWLGNLGLAAGAAATVLMGFEVGLRLLSEPPPRMVKGSKPPLFLDLYPSNPRGYFDLDLRRTDTRAGYEALLGRSLVEEARETPFAVEVRFNSLHFRDREVPPRRAGVRRVMVLGDSFTEGQGVREADTYPRVLERLLQEAEPGRWEVLNCGHRGADFPQLYVMFEQQVLPSDPDLVLYGMVLNDVAQTPAFGKRYPAINDWIREQRAEPPAWWPRSLGFVKDRLAARRIGEESTRWYREMYAEPNREGWASTERLIKQMAERMRARGGRLAIALWPLLVDLETSYPFAEVHRQIADFCRANGIPLVDLLPTLRTRPARALWVYPADRHPNEMAHRLAAESLALALRDLGPSLGPP